ncbi:lysozyme g-like [Alligator sinensis]|uniref:Lysozyme g n=1 Tax=Alligator sinensis TaxID=38654 RepID=A0A1U7S8V8_ALLSI|nr:lysozyme g-like [Alligator sinensis]
MFLALLILGLSALIAPSASQSCYGDITSLQTPVISCGPVKTIGCGVSASEKIAEIDIIHLRSYRTIIRRVAKSLCLEPSLIAAIISVGSRVGHLLENGWDHQRVRFGLMQIDRRYYPIRGTWNSEEHIIQGSTILTIALKTVRKTYPRWTWAQQLRGALCAYHSRDWKIQVYDGRDYCSGGNDYVNNVIIRAKYFKRIGF